MAIKQVAIIGAGTSVIAGGTGFGIYYLSPEQTIKEVLTKDNIKLISDTENDNVWKIALNERKNEPELKAPNAVATTFDTLKQWCLNNYKEPKSKKDQLAKVKKLCVQPPKNIGEKLDNASVVFVGNWETKLNDIKGKPDQLAKLNQIKNNFASQTNAKDELSKWCNNQRSEKLVPDTYEANYQKVVELCS